MNEILDEYALNKEPKKIDWRYWYYLFLGLLLVGSMVSTLLAWYDVETIVGSGPIMSIIGVVYVRLGVKVNESRAKFIGWLPLIISIFWFATIYSFSMRPNDCKFNVPFSLSFATVWILLNGMVILAKRK